MRASPIPAVLLFVCALAACTQADDFLSAQPITTNKSVIGTTTRFADSWPGRAVQLIVALRRDIQSAEESWCE